MATPPIYGPKALSWRGGEIVELRFTWNSATPFACTLIVAGQRYPCYSAIAGEGTDCLPSGPYLRCASPKLPDGSAGLGVMEVTDANGQTIVTLPFSVVPPFYPTTTYLLRALCPSVWAVGPTELAAEA